MAFPITAFGIVNALGASTDAVATNLAHARSALQRTPIGERSTFTGRVQTTLPAGPSREHALLRHAASELAPAIAGARRRWGSRRLAVVLGIARDPAPLLDLAVALTQTRGPTYAVTTGALSSAQALVSACGLLAADIADAVAVGTACSLDLDAPDLGEEPPRPLSPHSAGPASGEGAAWMLIERQATADFELDAVESLDVGAADWVITDANGDPQRDRDRLRVHRGSVPLVALAGYWGDLGPANGLTAGVAAALALDRGFVPASCLYDGPDPRIPSHAIDRDCDRVACTSSQGPIHVTLRIGTRSS